MKHSSPAKINLTLDIFSKKSEEKFHSIKTIFHKISLADEIEIKANNVFEIEGDFSCSMEENLIYKAYELVQKHCSINKPVKVLVQKNIPEKGGLGGGSSNFATFVKMYFQYFELGEVPESLIRASSIYGKDIPFFFEKGTCALGTNFGEKIESLDFNFSGTPCFIYQPKFGNNTAEMYQKIRNVSTNFTEIFLRNPDLNFCGNGFDEFLSETSYQNLFQNLDISNFTLSGSGSCFFSFEKLEVPHCKIFEVELR